MSSLLLFYCFLLTFLPSPFSYYSNYYYYYYYLSIIYNNNNNRDDDLDEDREEYEERDEGEGFCLPEIRAESVGELVEVVMDLSRKDEFVSAVLMVFFFFFLSLFFCFSFF